MKNRKGFTLVELLVVIVIIGVIAGLSWPVLRRVQDSSKMSKYDKYGDSMVAAAKLYVDSYEEDIFYYEDDLTEAQRNHGQCTYITFEELKEHALIKDYNVDGMSCNSDATYVKVTRKKGNYTYQYYLGCGDKKPNGAKLTEAEVYFTAPEQDHFNVPDYAACGTGVTEYRMTYNSNGGTHCRTKIGYKDATSNTKWGTLCTPARSGYTFTGWKDSGGNEVTANTLITGDITVIAQWRINKVYIKLNTNQGVLAATHGAGLTTSGDAVLYNGSDIMHELNYGASMDGNGLYNYNNTTALNIQRAGYHGLANEEWNTAPDGSGTSYDQRVRYRASDFCDASADDCTVILYVNWNPNKVIIKYNANGGTLFSERNPSFTQNGNKILRNNDEKVQVINYGEVIESLYNYNNPDQLNLGRVGYHADPLQAWNTQANGSGTSYNQDYGYSASDFCDATNADCTVTLYVKWIINRVLIKYNTNGGTLMPSHGSQFTTIGDSVRSNGDEIVQTINYGANMSSNGLCDYNNPGWINIGKVGYHAETADTWNTKPDGTGTSYNEETVYNAADFCEATYADCTVTMYPNWKINKVTIIYDLNGGHLIDPHKTNITNSGDTLYYDGRLDYNVLDYGQIYPSAGLWDYNNREYLNTAKSGCHVNQHTEWNTQSDGNGESFDQAYQYAATNFCDARYGNCTRRLYINWIC